MVTSQYQGKLFEGDRVKTNKETSISNRKQTNKQTKKQAYQTENKQYIQPIFWISSK
jgi:hypothetical protein